MRGYCFLDLEGNLVYKPAEYIEIDNPKFWQDNDPFILEIWKFDTSDVSSMYRMYSKFKVLRLNSTLVLEFTKAIGFNIDTLKAYKNEGCV
jgi:hypothetical protein